MATLLVVGNSEGQRRCDATCHNATGQTCRCCCGGRYHGKGSDGALRQVREDIVGEAGADLLEQLDAAGVRLTDAVDLQLTLDDAREAAWT